MYSNRQHHADSEEVVRIRREGGVWLRALREKAGLSQRELAAAIGMEYYSFISQIESGKGRVPTAQIRSWAEALDISPKVLAIELLRYYDPVNYELIFGDRVISDNSGSEVGANSNVVVDLSDRVAKLEEILNKKT